MRSCCRRVRIDKRDTFENYKSFVPVEDQSLCVKCIVIWIEIYSKSQTCVPIFICCIYTNNQHVVKTKQSCKVRTLQFSGQFCLNFEHTFTILFQQLLLNFKNSNMLDWYYFLYWLWLKYMNQYVILCVQYQVLNYNMNLTKQGANPLKSHPIASRFGCDKIQSQLYS